MWLDVINKVKVTHRGEGHIKVKVKYIHSFKFYVAHALCKRVVCIRLKCYLYEIYLHHPTIRALSSDWLVNSFVIIIYKNFFYKFQ